MRPVHVAASTCSAAASSAVRVGGPRPDSGPAQPRDRRWSRCLLMSSQRWRPGSMPSMVSIDARARPGRSGIPAICHPASGRAPRLPRLEVVDRRRRMQLAEDKINTLSGQGLDMVTFWRACTPVLADSGAALRWPRVATPLIPRRRLVTSHFQEGLPVLPGPSAGGERPTQTFWGQAAPFPRGSHRLQTVRPTRKGCGRGLGQAAPCHVVARREWGACPGAGRRAPARSARPREQTRFFVCERGRKTESRGAERARAGPRERQWRPPDCPV